MDSLNLRFKHFKDMSEATNSDLSDLVKQDPLSRTKINIENQMLKQERYRTKILQSVAAFKGMSVESLTTAAQLLEEMYYKNGDKIIRQDDYGESFFILEEGLVSVRRKMNSRDPDEEDVELAVKGKDFHFGDVSLLTGEPRSATIVVISETAKCLVMNKKSFDEICSTAKKIMATNRNIVCKAAINSLPFFKTMSKKNKARLVDTMVEVSYIKGTYIHRQATIDNSFNIITDGECSVTVNADDIREKEIKTLLTGDYFGESCLVHQDSGNVAPGKRQYNVIAKTHVTCVVLNFADYSYLVAQEAEEALGTGHKKAVLNAEGGVDRSMNALQFNKLKNMNLRRITVYDAEGKVSAQRVQSLLRRFAKFTTEALYINVYSRYYRDLKIFPEKIDYMYGKVASNVMNPSFTKKRSVDEIRYETKRILQMDRARRLPEDIAFINGLLNQKNALKDQYCLNWQPYQFLELCKKVTFKTVSSMTKVVHIGTKGSSAYLILRGAVRIFTFSKHTHNALHYEEDLMSGEMFLEGALNGQKTILITAQALSDCDLAIIEFDDYAAAQEKSSFKISIEDRYQFLTNIPHISHLEPSHIFQIAHNLVQKECEKNNFLVEKGDKSSSILFLVDGRLDVIASSKNNTNKRAVTCIQRHGIFGEIGFINSRLPSKQRLREEFDYICETKVEYFELSKDSYNKLDGDTWEEIRKAWISKTLWRRERYFDMRVKEVNNGIINASKKFILQKSAVLLEDSPFNQQLTASTNELIQQTVNDRKKSLSVSQKQLTAFADFVNDPDFNSSWRGSTNIDTDSATMRPSGMDPTLLSYMERQQPMVSLPRINNYESNTSRLPNSRPGTSNLGSGSIFRNTDQSLLDAMFIINNANSVNPLMVLSTCKTPLETRRTISQIKASQNVLPSLQLDSDALPINSALFTDVIQRQLNSAPYSSNTIEKVHEILSTPPTGSIRPVSSQALQRYGEYNEQRQEAKKALRKLRHAVGAEDIKPKAGFNSLTSSNFEFDVSYKESSVASKNNNHNNKPSKIMDILKTRKEIIRREQVDEPRFGNNDYDYNRITLNDDDYSEYTATGRSTFLKGSDAYPTAISIPKFFKS